MEEFVTGKEEKRRLSTGNVSALGHSLFIFISVEGKTPIQQKHHHQHHPSPLYQTDGQKNIGQPTTKEDLSVSS